MAATKKRSPGSRGPRFPSKSALTRPASTYLTEEVGRLLTKRCDELRIKEAAFIRDAIEVALGVGVSIYSPTPSTSQPKDS